MARTNSPRIRWKREHRIVLHLLAERRNLSWTDRSAIFSSLFCASLKEWGFSDNVHPNRLTVQYAERKKPSASRHWQGIVGEISPRAQSEHEALQLRIVEVERAMAQAKLLGPVLKPQTVTPTNRMMDQALPTPPRTFSTRENVPEDAYRARNASKRSLRKRYALATSEDDSDSPSDIILTTLKNPTLAFKRPRLALGSPKTPQTRGKRSGRKNPMRVLHRFKTGHAMYLTPREIQETEAERRNPSSAPPHAEVFPSPGSLLFRFWDNRSQSPLNEKGEFVAGRFNDLDPEPPTPLLEHWRYWQYDMLIHINGTTKATPFVSVSNHFFWTLRRALKERDRGHMDIRISLIDPTKLSPRSVFYVAPLLKKLKAQRRLESGKMRYFGTHEFLVHYKIPAEAIISTMDLGEVWRLAARDSCLAQALAMDAILRGDWITGVLPKLRLRGITWTAELTKSMARLAGIFGFNARSKTEQLAHFIQDITTGWGLKIAPLARDEWLNLSRTFALTICPIESSSAKEIQSIRLSFLEGVQCATGPFNAQFSRKTVALIPRSARKIGLESPAQMLLDEMDGAKVHLFIHQRRQQNLLRSYVDNATRGDMQADTADVGDIEQDDVQIAQTKSVDQDELELGQSRLDEERLDLDESDVDMIDVEENGECSRFDKESDNIVYEPSEEAT